MACRGRRLHRRLDRGLRAPEGGEARVRIVRALPMCCGAEPPAIVAVDMPIGLPERIGAGGRAAESCVRPLLGARQSSVFSCRRARRSMPPTIGEACRIARPHRNRRARCRSSSSTSRRKSARSTRRCAPDRGRARRVFEVHPELAFWRLNGERALTEPKKVKSRPYEPGLALRRDCSWPRASRQCRERTAAQRRGGRRPARCTGLCRHRAADPCRDRAAVPEPAAARRVWIADGNLGMRFARN